MFLDPSQSFFLYYSKVFRLQQICTKRTFIGFIYLEQSLLGLTQNKKNVPHHKEESKARMKIDRIDCDKLRKYLVTSITHFFVDGYSPEIVLINLGKLIIKEMKVDSCKTIGEK